MKRIMILVLVGISLLINTVEAMNAPRSRRSYQTFPLTISNNSEKGAMVISQGKWIRVEPNEDGLFFISRDEPLSVVSGYTDSNGEAHVFDLDVRGRGEYVVLSTNNRKMELADAPVAGAVAIMTSRGWMQLSNTKASEEKAPIMEKKEDNFNLITISNHSKDNITVVTSSMDLTERYKSDHLGSREDRTFNFSRSYPLLIETSAGNFVITKDRDSDNVILKGYREERKVPIAGAIAVVGPEGQVILTNTEVINEVVKPNAAVNSNAAHSFWQ